MLGPRPPPSSSSNRDSSNFTQPSEAALSSTTKHPRWGVMTITPSGGLTNEYNSGGYDEQRQVLRGDQIDYQWGEKNELKWGLSPLVANLIQQKVERTDNQRTDHHHHQRRRTTTTTSNPWTEIVVDDGAHMGAPPTLFAFNGPEKHSEHLITTIRNTHANSLWLLVCVCSRSNERTIKIVNFLVEKSQKFSVVFLDFDCVV